MMTKCDAEQGVQDKSIEKEVETKTQSSIEEDLPAAKINLLKKVHMVSNVEVKL